MLGQILIELIRINTEKESIIKPMTKLEPDKEFSAIVANIVKYIKNHYSETIDSEILEKELAYSYRYLSKVFQKEINMTPVKYIEKYKHFKAKEFLKNTDFEIKYISDLLGYQNVHDFSRSFKKNAGMPPNKWRCAARLDLRKIIIIHPGFVNTSYRTKTPS
jgi:YesN/AraC family two-component response regulator